MNQNTRELTDVRVARDFNGDLGVQLWVSSENLGEYRLSPSVALVLYRQLRSLLNLQED